jgi:hypothetical protein
MISLSSLFTGPFTGLGSNTHPERTNPGERRKRERNPAVANAMGS